MGVGVMGRGISREGKGEGANGKDKFWIHRLLHC
jgi:hypothetical protein